MGKLAFISHASEDEAIAIKITDYLDRNGVSCWIAPRDVTPGRDYSAEIVEGIESSAVFVLVLSENANESIFVKREVERAVSKGKPVFPIRVREVTPSRSLELFISSAHWIDAWKPPIEKYLERLAQSISSAAALYPASAPEATPKRRTIARSWPARRQRGLPTVIVATLVLLLLSGAAWYAYGLLGSSSSGRSSGALAIRKEPNVPEAPPLKVAETPVEEVAPAAGPIVPRMGQTASREVVAPTSSSDALGPCPRNLSISPDLLTPFTCLCGNQVSPRRGSVWGTDVYTDRSDLCRAALHAGAITAEGGPITVTRSEGQPIYAGSSRNGVTTKDYGSWDASITFAGTAPFPYGPCPSRLSISPDLTTPFTCICGRQAGSSRGLVWGTDVYTDRSDLCRAALHAGAITAEGGSVTVTRSEGQPIYAGSSRNGVTTKDYGRSKASIRFE